MTKVRILMVCLGKNICRSPLAEGILREKIKDKSVTVTIDSGGTGSYHIGEPPETTSHRDCKEIWS